MKSAIQNETQAKLGIIAGGGELPKHIIDWCIAHSQPYFVLGIKGNVDESYLSADVPHTLIRIGQAGTGFKVFKEQNVQKIILIGTIKRPSFAELIPDLRTTAFFAKIGSKALGDDSILRALVNELEQDGMTVVGIHEVMPELLAPCGILTKEKPGKEDKIDIVRGVEVAETLGKLDVGQSVVTQQGLVLGVEGIEGTDKLIKRCADYVRKGKAPVMVKLRKPQQDMRIDLPTIGVTTVENAHQSGFKGIVVHSGNTLIVNQKQVVKLADKYKMFIIGIEPSEYK